MDKPTGVAMAGGKSSRIGTDKGLMSFRDKLLVAYSIELLDAFCPEILISTQNHDYLQFGLPIISDEFKNCGPIGGLYSTLMAAKSDYVLVLACDMPFVSPEIIRKLIESIGDYECIVPQIDDKIEPLCAIYSKSLIPEIGLRIDSGNYALQSLVRDSNSHFVHFDDESFFRNINTAQDFDLNDH